jgi:CBS domain-containing protein
MFLRSTLLLLVLFAPCDAFSGPQSRVFVSTPVSKLSKKRVVDCMTHNPCVLRPNLSVDDAMSMLLNSGLHSAPVVDDEHQLVGMVSSFDFLQKEAFDGALLPMEGSTAQIEKYVAAAKKICGQTVRDIMSDYPVTVQPDTFMREAAQILSAEKVHHLPVVEGTKLVGILSTGDIMRDLLRIVRNLQPAADGENKANDTIMAP